MSKRKIIKSVRDLPEWFSLDNYKAAATLDAALWRENIGWRVTWEKQRASGAYSSSEDFLDELQSFFVQYLDEGLSREEFERKLENEPDSCMVKLPVQWVFTTRHDWQYKQRGMLRPNFASVETVRMREIFSGLLHPNDRKMIFGVVDEWQAMTQKCRYQVSTDDGKLEWLRPVGLSEEESQRYGQLSDWMEGPVDGAAHWYARIDPLASDEQIKRDFELWLKNMRRLAPAHQQKNVTDSRFWTWADCQVLAHFDLEFVTGLDGVKIQKEVMAEALFPGKDNAENLYKTAVKHKNIAISQATADALYYQITGGLREETENF